MTPQAVASAPKDPASPRLPPAPSADGNFAHLVAGIGLDSAAKPTANAPHDPGPAQDRAKTKDKSGDTPAPASAAVAPAPASPADITARGTRHGQNAHDDAAPAQAGANTQNQSDAASSVTPAAAAAASASPPQTPPTADAAADATGQVLAAGAAPNPTPAAVADARDTATRNAASSPGSANLPMGAAALNARVIAGAPTYVSQPNSALAGLWHHAGDTAPLAPRLPSADNAPAAPAADGDPAGAAPDSALAKAGAALSNGVTASPQAVTGVGGGASTSTGMTSNGAEALNGGSPSEAITVPLPGTTATSTTTASSAPAAGTAPPTPVVIPAVAQVAVNLSQAAQNGTDRIEIQLKPESLGAIEVKLDLTHDGRITAVISADRSDTLNLLRQDSGQLQQALRDAGLQADAGSLSFNLRGDSQSFSQNATPTRGNAVSATSPVAAAASRIDIARSRYHAGALDIEV